MSTGLRVNANQLATLLVMDAAIANLQTGANQLGAFLKLEAEANILVEAALLIATKKEALQKNWANGIIVAQPADVPRLVNP